MKPRFEPDELKIFRILNVRMSLSDSDKKKYENLEKGFRGEQAFDEYLQELTCDCIILNNLLLEANNTVFQIDSLLITREKIYLFEVKNYEGDFYIQNDKWYTISSKKINSPLLQLERCDSLFQQFMENVSFNLPLESYLVFVNPEFNLYQASLNLPIIFPTQLNRFMKKLAIHSAKLSDTHKSLAKQILSLHLEKSPFKRFPNYSFAQLKKGVICTSCFSFMDYIYYGNIICQKCSHSEKVDDAILRSIHEYQILFPDRKITTSSIYQWCDVIKNERKIRNVLLKHFKSVGTRRHRYYVDSCLGENLIDEEIKS